MSAPVPRPRTDVRIEAMQRRDVRSVLRIERRSYPRPWTPTLFLSELAQPVGRAYLVARPVTVDRPVLGYAGLMLVLPDAHVTTIAVDPAHRRCGIATRLLVGLVTEAVARGATALTLEVRPSNGAAQALYRAFGFESAGVRRGYYGDNGEDAVVMWARGIDEPEYAERLEQLAQLASAPIDDREERR